MTSSSHICFRLLNFPNSIFFFFNHLFFIRIIPFSMSYCSANLFQLRNKYYPLRTKQYSNQYLHSNKFITIEKLSQIVDNYGNFKVFRLLECMYIFVSIVLSQCFVYYNCNFFNVILFVSRLYVCLQLFFVTIYVLLRFRLLCMYVLCNIFVSMNAFRHIFLSMYVVCYTNTS